MIKNILFQAAVKGIYTSVFLASIVAIIGWPQPGVVNVLGNLVIAESFSIAWRLHKRGLLGKNLTNGSLARQIAAEGHVTDGPIEMAAIFVGPLVVIANNILT